MRTHDAARQAGHKIVRMDGRQIVEMEAGTTPAERAAAEAFVASYVERASKARQIVAVYQDIRQRRQTAPAEIEKTIDAWVAYWTIQNPDVARQIASKLNVTPFDGDEPA